jgi:protein SCO1/2
MKRLLMSCLCLLLVAPVLAATPLPGDSIYQLGATFTDQAGHSWPLSARRGRVQLMTMFYTSCTMVCPMIVDTMKATRKAVDEPARDRLDLLAVSFDPARDNVAALRQYAQKRQLDAPRWTLARAEPQDVRALSALLGLQYRQLPDGDFNHSSELILLDPDGRIIARTTTIGRLDPTFVDAVRKALASG